MNLSQTIDQTRERAFGAARRFKSAIIDRAGFVFDKAENLRKDAIDGAEKLGKEAIEEGKELRAKIDDVVGKTIEETREAAEEIAKPLLKGGKKSKKRATKRAKTAKKAIKRAAGPTKAELYKLATEMKIAGRSKMTKLQLAEAIKAAAN